MIRTVSGVVTLIGGVFKKCRVGRRQKAATTQLVVNICGGEEEKIYGIYNLWVVLVGVLRTYTYTICVLHILVHNVF